MNFVCMFMLLVLLVNIDENNEIIIEKDTLSVLQIIFFICYFFKELTYSFILLAILKMSTALGLPAVTWLFFSYRLTIFDVTYFELIHFFFLLLCLIF